MGNGGGDIRAELASGIADVAGITNVFECGSIIFQENGGDG